MYAQIDIKYNLPFTKVERENIKNIKSILKKAILINQLFINMVYF